MTSRLKHTAKVITLLLIASAALCFQNEAQAQIISTSGNSGVLSVQHFDTRSLSMGSATVSDLYGRPSMGINPALSGLYQNNLVFQINTNYSWNTRLMQYSLQFPTISVENHRITARIGFMNEGFDELDFWENSQIPVPDAELYHADIAYAFAFSEVFSLGVNQRIAYALNKGTNDWAYSADFGLVYAPAENISYAIVFRGLGNEISYEIAEAGATILGSKLMQQSLEVGATFRFPTEGERTFLTISFANEKEFGNSGLWYKGGMELLPFSFLAIRGGLLFNLDDSVFIPRTGIGFVFSFGRFDYMLAPGQRAGEYFHQAGLTLKF
ncbi:MAG: hypothetical protein LAT67_02620 [Balneolales bacterium]|nr:hypothetical protein [Balneolales bacterium]